MAPPAAPVVPPTAPGFEDYGLNYTFLLYCYLFLAAVSACLCAAQYQLGVASVTGFWLVPAPAALALPVLWYLARKQRAAGLPVVEGSPAAAAALKKAQ